MLYFTVQPSPPRLPRLLALLLLAFAVVAASPCPVGAAAPTPLVSSCVATPGQLASSDCTLWRPVRDRRTGAIGYTIAAIRIFRAIDQLPDVFKTHAGGRVYDVVNSQGKPQPRNGTMEVSFREAIPRPLASAAGLVGVLVSPERKEVFVTKAHQPSAQLDDTPTHLPEELPDPFADVAPRERPQAVIARAIQRDGAAIGADFDDAFAAELAERVLEALRDDEEAAVDLASFVFDADVRRALTA